MNAPGYLEGKVKHYEWGGYDFIPSLLEISNIDKKPFAEYWLGVHPQADCMVVQPGGSKRLLQECISTMPAATLGEHVSKRFGNLPYLLKALDVKDMLSIQVHPSKEAAEIEFANENAKGIPMDSPLRNYKDANHKPELMVAMGDFWLLHGFKPSADLKKTLHSVPEFKQLLQVFEQAGYKGLYTTLMQMPQNEVNEFLQPLLKRISPLFNTGKLEKSQADYWAAKAALSFSKTSEIDRGIFSIYLFNLLQLRRGEAIFQDAGVPHAYLEGRNVEIMASSDNVLRGGLTTKRVDVAALLKHVKCEATYPRIIQGEKKGAELVYRTPAPDFELSCFLLKPGEHVSTRPITAEIFLLVAGEVILSYDSFQLDLKNGQPAAIAWPGRDLQIEAKQPSWLFRATVPFTDVD